MKLLTLDVQLADRTRKGLWHSEGQGERTFVCDQVQVRQFTNWGLRIGGGNLRSGIWTEQRKVCDILKVKWWWHRNMLKFKFQNWAGPVLLGRSLNSTTNKTTQPNQRPNPTHLWHNFNMTHSSLDPFLTGWPTHSNKRHFMTKTRGGGAKLKVIWNKWFKIRGARSIFKKLFYKRLSDITEHKILLGILLRF